jgi:hypothetical protein
LSKTLKRRIIGAIPEVILEKQMSPITFQSKKNRSRLNRTPKPRLKALLSLLGAIAILALVVAGIAAAGARKLFV